MIEIDVMIAASGDEDDGDDDDVLEDVMFHIAPQLEPFVSVAPESISAISLGIQVPLLLTISIPLTTPIGAYEGTIHLKDSEELYPQPLKLSLQVGELIGSAGGVVESGDGLASLNIPPGALSDEPSLITIARISIDELPPVSWGTAQW